MKIQYTNELHLSESNIARLHQINTILEDYRIQGYILTLRQLYYQLVSTDIIPNIQREYAKLSIMLGKGRMAGVVDWSSIEDRIRVPKIPYYAANIPDAIDDITRQYRLDRMRDQKVYIEVWIEKDALSGIVSKVTNKYHCRLMVNRGYSSITAMHDAALRFEQQIELEKKCIILYLGDHDPSGMDMVRDIGNRLQEFNVKVEVIHCGLLDEQIKKYNPPPNPTKLDDPRASDYIAKYGKTCWEVDALKPQVLNDIIEKQIVGRIDLKKFNALCEKERDDIATLKQLQKDMEDE